jgi:hypothetical protein
MGSSPWTLRRYSSMRRTPHSIFALQQAKKLIYSLTHLLRKTGDIICQQFLDGLTLLGCIDFQFCVLVG